jgi:RNA polymerase sigma-70 factor (ECF subfamily)
MSRKNITEEAIQSFNNRQEAGFKEIFDELFYELRVYSSNIIANWYESEDVVLKCFLKLWQSNAKFTTWPSLSAYMYKMVKNHSLNYNRSLPCRLDKKTYDEAAALNIEDKKEHDAYCDKLKQLNEFIGLLPTRCQEVMRLHLWGYDTRQISERLGVSMDTVQTHKTRAVVALRKRFKNENNNNI